VKDESNETRERELDENEYPESRGSNAREHAGATVLQVDEQTEAQEDGSKSTVSIPPGGGDASVAPPMGTEQLVVRVIVH
jgi:hypothetical protein